MKFVWLISGLFASGIAASDAPAANPTGEPGSGNFRLSMTTLDMAGDGGADDGAAESANPVLSPEELQRYTGDFWEAADGFAAEVRVIDGKLWAVHSPTRKNELVPIGPNRFEMTGTPGKVYVEYTLGASGVIDMRRTINGKPRGRFTPFERRQVSVAELAGYAGTFHCAELDIEYRLVVDSGALHFILEDELPHELTALFGETFENPDFGSFTFERDSTGKVSRFRLQSGRVRNLLFERR